MSRKFFSAMAALLWTAARLCAQNIISPAEGTWANRQMLVLDMPASSTAYYSLNGADPESSGFAYDGPVLLDMDGEIRLRVTVVDADGGKSDRTVWFRVEEAPLPDDGEAAAFLRGAAARGIVDYTAGDEFVIPSSVEYSMGPPPEIFAEGAAVSVPKSCVIPRYVPCAVTDGTARWRFVLRVSPAATGVYSRRDVPFEISDWDTVTFTDQRLLYKIDDSWWSRPSVPVRLDRSVSHMISWQRIDYSPENPVKFYVLPPRPDLVTERSGNGAVSVRLPDGSGYQLGVIDGSGRPAALYDSVEIDTFAGDACKGTVTLGIFYDSVYHGQTSFDFDVYKKMPRCPVIVSSAPDGFSRGAVTVEISCDDRDELLVAASGPVLLPPDSDFAAAAAEIPAGEYGRPAAGTMTLLPAAESAAAYRISACAVSRDGGRSRAAEYTVVIDPYQYYVDGASSAADADGTKARPYPSFAGCLEAVGDSRLAVIRVSGRAEMPAGATLLSANCRIEGTEDARIVFAPESSVILRNASLAVDNCVIELSGNSAAPAPKRASLFQLERGVLDLRRCEIAASFGESGTVIDADSSVVSLSDSGVTAVADVYASALSAVNSRISVRDSRISTVAETSVNFSAQGGTFELTRTSCRVTGGLGRIAELFDTQSAVTENAFAADLKGAQSSGEPVYMDSRTVSANFSGNVVTGF